MGAAICDICKHIDPALLLAPQLGQDALPQLSLLADDIRQPHIRKAGDIVTHGLQLTDHVAEQEGLARSLPKPAVV